MTEQFDVIIIGQGPAGLSAAIYLQRGGKRALALGRGGEALAQAELVENYFGFPEPISGAELLARGRRQAERLGAVLRAEEVLGLTWEGDFTVETAAASYRAPAVLAASGRTRLAPRLPGLETYSGHGVSFCAVCDGFFFRRRRLGVLGAGDFAAHELRELLPFTNDITVFADGASGLSPLFPPDIPVVRERVLELRGGETLERVVTEGGEYPVDGLFIALGSAGAADFARRLGAAEKDGRLLTDGSRATNVPGLFAAGDCAGDFAQVATAVADGALAARGILRWLRGK